MIVTIKATTDMVLHSQKASGWCLVDTRTSDAFIGWTSSTERGGHIPHAKLFSWEWLKPFWRSASEDYDVRLKLQLETQGISKEKNVVLYDENGKDAEIVAAYLEEIGFDKVFYFDLAEWKGDLGKYPNYRLMAPMWLVNDLINGKGFKDIPTDDVKVFEIDWRAPSEIFLKHHLPKAVHMDSEEFEKPPAWVHPGDDELFEFVENNGITPDTVVIVYANVEIGSPAKVQAMLRYMGVKHVFVMNGTLNNWMEAGYPTESGDPPKQPCKVNREDFVFDRSHILNMEDIKKILADPTLGCVVDTRSWKGYIGADSGYDYVKKSGRIPGTKWCSFPRMYGSPIDTVANLEIMINVWENRGLDLSKPCAFFCGSASWGAAQVKMFGNMAGINNATIYEGGWCEWQCYPENPIETGIPKGMEDYDPNEYYSSEIKSSGKCHVL